MLDRFAIDYSLCMYCSICIEVCPFDALYWSPEFEYAEYDLRDLLHEKDRLRDWMWTVPPPPAHDPNGEPAKEVAEAAGDEAVEVREQAADDRDGAAAVGEQTDDDRAEKAGARRPAADARDEASGVREQTEGVRDEAAGVREQAAEDGSAE